MSGNSPLLRLLPLVLGLAVAAPAPALAQAVVTDARIGVHGRETHFVLDLSAPISVERVFTLSGPYRVVIDLPSSEMQPDLRNEKADTGIISGYRSGRYYRPGTFRMVLELKGPVRVRKHFSLPPDPDHGYRHVFHLEPVSAETFAHERRAARLTAATIPAPPAPAIKPRRPGGKKLIVIDPGHGGIDPGATRGRRIYEKHITLEVAKRLKHELEKSGRYEVALTRERDIFIALRDRIAKASQLQAELFVSVHADTIGKRQVRGASVYTLSEEASDPDAAAFAARENKADLLAGIDMAYFEEEPEAGKILIDMAQNAAKNCSNQFAKFLVDELRRSRQRLLRKPQRSAGFAVLKAPGVPSVLVELGYLSNKHDARRLVDPTHQATLARAVRQAIGRFFQPKCSMIGTDVSSTR
ncbi:MAG: N-acetylmuramoyl-L-alanine amidase [Kiloniellales bacterium]